MNLKNRLLPALILSLVSLAACRGGLSEDPILALAADESLVQGKALMEKEKFADARRYLLHAFEVEPNSAQGREALLLAADCFYLDGGNTNWIQSEAKYRDFQNRFPTSSRAAYVQFQIGRSLAARMERPDRDQSTATHALQAFEDLVRLFPTSEQAAQAETEIRRIRDNLAEHEYRVAVFYLRFGLPQATVGRLEGLLAQFPDYTPMDKVLYHLGMGYVRVLKWGEAANTFDRLKKEYPSSEWVRDIPDLVGAPPGAEPELPAPSAPTASESGR